MPFEVVIIVCAENYQKIKKIKHIYIPFNTFFAALKMTNKCNFAHIQKRDKTKNDFIDAEKQSI